MAHFLAQDTGLPRPANLSTAGHTMTGTDFLVSGIPGRTLSPKVEMCKQLRAANHGKLSPTKVSHLFLITV